MNDNSKSKAISAGAMLRRYGEQALRDVSTVSGDGDTPGLLNDSI